MYKVWFVNHNYYANETFNSLDEAVTYGKSKGFDFRVDCGGVPVGAWSIIGGFKRYH